MKQRRYIMLFGDTRAAVNELDDDAAGRLLKAILRYAEDRGEVELPGEEKLIYRMLLNQFARDDESYRKRVERSTRHRESTAALSGQSGASPEQSAVVDALVMQYKDKDKDKDKDEDQYEDKDKDEDKDGYGCAPVRAAHTPPTSPTPPRFTPPTPEEVRAYCQEANLQFDPVRFCDYNASRGWRMGSSPMTDWKAAARVWAARGDVPAAGSSPPRPPREVSHQQYAQREYANSLDALDQMMARYLAGQGEAAKPPPYA